jgi:hypothetical protein
MNNCIFEIPIYRCSAEQFVDDMENDTKKHLERLEQTSGATRETAPHSFEISEKYFRDTYGGPWQYNQIIGWLQICTFNNIVSGELWFIDAKRIYQKLIAKHYVMRGTAFELHNCNDKSSDAIYQMILAEIEKIRRKPPFAKRHLDLTLLQRLGEVIDWQKLINKN